MTGPRRRLKSALRQALRRSNTARELDKLLLAVGHLETRLGHGKTVQDLAEAEFRIFSQFGEDGIIQYLISRVPIEVQAFVEFGVEDYSESNTRFLLSNNNWRGLIMDAGTSHIEFIRTNDIGWRNAIDAVSAFITAENINALIGEAGFRGDIGLLSIDLDGIDYWVLKAIDVVSPRILIAEYNSTFGPEAAVTIPHDPGFQRTHAHHSNLYWGASLPAICAAAQEKGYKFVGSNSAGNNAFFVRQDVLGSIRVLSAREGWVDARFRESRDASGNLTFVGSREARLDAIAEMPLFDVEANSVTTVAARLPGSSQG